MLFRILSILFPVACAACGALGPSPCAACLDALRRPPPLPPPIGVDRLAALLAYDGAGRELVARLKYRNARAAVPWLAAAMAGLVDATTVDVVTWVPTTPRRRRRRGFDQARLLARAVARELGRPCPATLHRGPGPPQTGRPLAERRRRPALRPTARALARLRGARVLLVDDVCTSGTTLAAAADALRRAGAAEVTAVAAARTLRHGRAGAPLHPATSMSDSRQTGGPARGTLARCTTTSSGATERSSPRTPASTAGS